MTRTRFQSMEEIVADDLFPRVDLALRAGRHFDLADVEEWSFLTDAAPFLEGFYARYHCRLVQSPDSYWYLVPEGDLLPVRRLRAAEMVVGQTMALLLLDPAITETRGILPRTRVLETLAGIVGQDELPRLVLDRPLPRDIAVAAERVRERIAGALRSLSELGFVQLLPGELLLIRPATLRFADAARLAPSLEEGLRILVARGSIDLASESGDG